MAVTLGQVDSINETFVKCAENTADATGNLLKETTETTMNIGRLILFSCLVFVKSLIVNIFI